MNDTAQHKFEAAGLGKAPFRVVGFEVKKFQACQGAPIQAGASCDFCATSIMNVYWVKGSGLNDNRFKVGCDCVEKTGDRGLIRRAKNASSEHKAAASRAAKESRVKRLYTLLTMDAVVEALEGDPHPMSWRADEGDTRVDWATWMLRHSGMAGKTKLASYVEKVANGLGIKPRKVDEGDEDSALARLDPRDPAPKAETPVLLSDPEPGFETEPTFEPAESEWIGTVGNRVSFSATVEATIECEGFRPYQSTMLYKFVDDDGNQAAWFNSGRAPRRPDGELIEEGDRVMVIGRVKDHTFYRGARQTTLTRCKVELM